jgi:hypothetical protein
MKTRLMFSGLAAFLCAGALSSAQIAPQGGSQQRPPQPTTSQPRATVSEEPPSTFTGCLYHEDAIPGRSPNVAEKAGVLEDYILADATMSRDQNRTPLDQPIAEAGEGSARPGQPETSRPGQTEAGPPDAPRPVQTESRATPPGGAAGLATSRMYKVTKLADDRLKPLVGKRVEVTGTVKPDDDVRPGDKAVNFENLPNIEATSIREVAGATCPTRPAGSTTATPTPSPNR